MSRTEAGVITLMLHEREIIYKITRNPNYRTCRNSRIAGLLFVLFSSWGMCNHHIAPGVAACELAPMAAVRDIYESTWATWYFPTTFAHYIVYNPRSSFSVKPLITFTGNDLLSVLLLETVMYGMHEMWRTPTPESTRQEQLQCRQMAVLPIFSRFIHSFDKEKQSPQGWHFQYGSCFKQLPGNSKVGLRNGVEELHNE